MRYVLILTIMLVAGFKAQALQPIKVGVIEGAPFAIKSGSTYSGIAVDLWNEIALGLRRSYIIQEPSYTNWDKPFEDLINGRVDVIIGPTSVTADRYMKGDFTLPYFIDKVIAVTPSDYFHNTFRLIRIFFLSVGSLLLSIFILFAIYIHLLWYYERTHTPKVPKSYKSGVPYLFWIHVLSGHHDEVPKSTQGKLLMLFQRGSFYIILIMLNATMISFLTISLQQYSSPIQSLSDLERVKVGATKSSRSLNTAASLGIRAMPFNSIKDGIKALEGRQISAFLTDLSLADSYLRENNITNLSLSHFTLKFDLYVFITRKGSPLIREINEQMLILRTKGIPEKICKSYLTKGVQNCDL